MKFLLYLPLLTLISSPVYTKAADFYLFYNSGSEYISEIDIDSNEIAKVFDDEFGPAAEELPLEVRYEDFYVSKFPDGNYVFTLKAPFNCGRLGCLTRSYKRDEDGDLQFVASSFPVKCKEHEPDKILCIKGGYKVEKPKKPAKKGPIHYPAPKPE